MWAGISQVAMQATKQCPLPLHEALALAVPQNATLSARALCDEAPSSVDACGMELHKLQVLHKQHCLIALLRQHCPVRIRQGFGDAQIFDNRESREHCMWCSQQQRQLYFKMKKQACLQWDASACCHAIAISCACVR